MSLTRDHSGTITSFIQLYNRMARAGLFVRVDTDVGEWELIPMEGISARDYWSLILINDGMPHRGPVRSRSRSPIHHLDNTAQSPVQRRRTPSPNYSPRYSPASSRASSPLYIDEDDDEVDGVEVIEDGPEPELVMERNADDPAAQSPLSPSPPPSPVPVPSPSPAPVAVPLQLPVPRPLPFQVHLPLPVPLPYPVHLPLPVPVQIPVHLPFPAPLPLPVPVHVQPGLNMPRRNLCSVCQDPEAFTNVLYFRCRHMICEICWAGLYEYGDPHRCPQCRTRGISITGIIQ